MGDDVRGAHHRDAGQAGVRLRCYLDLRPPLPPGSRGDRW
ncbi:DUF6207 family protein [Streptomyces sp. CL12-4]